MYLSISLGGRPEKTLTPVDGTPQTKPRRSYVYAHTKQDGKYFYIGKGTGDRAWSIESRHPLWHRYVRTRLDGKFSVLILQDDLSSEEAEGIEDQWIPQEAETLVNWISVGRKTDYAENARFRKLRDANWELIACAKQLEKSDLEAAVCLYIQAICAIDGYIDIEYESGLVAELLKEERAEFGKQGEFAAIDRLSMCLVKLGRAEEAAAHVQSYFHKFAGDSNLAAAAAVVKRIERALTKNPGQRGAD